jgi:nitrous oxidase accessory protein NosD
VKFNLIQNNNNLGPGSGNGIQTNFGLCNATIDSNKFSGDTNSSVLVFGPPVSSIASNITVSNNELVAGTTEGIAFLGVSNSTITGNVSTGSTSDGTISLFGGDSTVMINSNTLLNGMRGIFVDNPYATFGISINSGVTAQQNCIKGNSIACLEVDLMGHSGTLDQ